MAVTITIAAAINLSAQDADTLATQRRGLMPVPASVEWKEGRTSGHKNFCRCVCQQTR